MKLTRQEITQKLTTLLVEQLGIEPADVTPEAKFYGDGLDKAKDLGCDSLDAVELVMAVEEEFEVGIPDEEAEQIQTVAQAVDWLAGCLQASDY